MCLSFHKLSASYKIACNSLGYRIAEVFYQQKTKIIIYWIFLFHKLTTSDKIRCNRVGCRITEVFQLLAELYTSLSIKGGTHKKSPVISFVIAFRKIQIVKKHLRNALYLYSIKYRQVLKSSVSTLVIASQRFENIKSVCLHFLSFHKLSTDLKIACNRVGYRITEYFHRLKRCRTSFSTNRIKFVFYFRHKNSPTMRFLTRGAFSLFGHIRHYVLFIVSMEYSHKNAYIDIFPSEDPMFCWICV